MHREFVLIGSNIRRFFLTFFSFLIFLTISNAEVLVSRSSSWKYFKGFSEASAPDSTAWRNAAFNDSSWNSASAPFRYGDGSGGTVLSDMKNAIHLSS